MPGFDGTGPRGQGAMTGAGRGMCAGNYAGAYTRVMGGRGGSARSGRGCRNIFYATGIPGWARATRRFPFSGYGANISSAEEQAFLTDRVGLLQDELNVVTERLNNLKKNDPQQ